MRRKYIDIYNPNDLTDGVRMTTLKNVPPLIVKRIGHMLSDPLLVMIKRNMEKVTSDIIYQDIRKTNVEGQKNN